MRDSRANGRGFRGRREGRRSSRARCWTAATRTTRTTTSATKDARSVANFPGGDASDIGAVELQHDPRPVPTGGTPGSQPPPVITAAPQSAVLNLVGPVVAGTNGVSFVANCAGLPLRPHREAADD